MALEIEKLGVFQVFTGGGTGTGFLIEPKLLLTNCHVVSGYRTVAVEQRDKRRIVGNVRRLHPKRDLAIVELSTPLDGEILSVEREAALEVKSQIHIVGFPIGLPLCVTEGVVSNPSQTFDGLSYVQTDAAINPGNSGGPMLNEQKRVVAVTTCKISSADMVGFGIPGTAVAEFIDGFRDQKAAFGVMCPSCDGLLESSTRYCDSCGTDLEGLELEAYFEPEEQHPIVAFVENALTKASVDPILARHGELNWSFHHGSAPIKIWCCCSEHLCFSSPLAQTGKQKLGELFRFLLSAEHAPFSFDLAENVVRLNLTVHMSDVFGHAASHENLSRRIGEFINAADAFDNMLIDKYACAPAPETQVTFLKEQSER